MVSASGGIVLDLSQAQTLGALDEGQRYLAAVTKMNPGKAKASGQGKVDVEFTVQLPVALKGRKLFRTYSTQPQALFGLYALLVALGVTDEELKGKDAQGKAKPFVLVPEKYLGIAVTLSVRNREWEDTMRSEVRAVRSASAYAEGAVAVADSGDDVPEVAPAAPARGRSRSNI